MIRRQPPSGTAAAVTLLALTVPGMPVAHAQDGVWTPVGDGISGPLEGGRGTVKALAVHEDRLFVGGLLARAGDAEVGNIAAWDGERWDALEGGTDRPVDALLPFADALAVAGSFRRAGEVPASGVALRRDDAWHALGTGLDGWVAALHVHDDRLVAGGQFLRAGEDSVLRVAAWDGERWSSIGEGLGRDGRKDRRRRRAPVEVVYALATHQDQLIAGGVLERSGGTRLENVARFDGTAWQPMGDGLDGDVMVFMTYRNHLLAGGKFVRSGSTVVNHVAAWDGNAWHPVAARLSLEPGVGRWVYALTPRDGGLLVGGCFVKLGTEDAEFVASWDGTYWRAIRTGLDQCVHAITIWRDDVYMGGSFVKAGLGTSRHLVRWQPES